MKRNLTSIGTFALALAALVLAVPPPRRSATTTTA
jgi:hypothetical protein